MKVVSSSFKADPALAGAARAGVGTHSHLVRNIDAPDELALENLLKWTRAHDVKAVGIGSPWTHASGLTYRKHEKDLRDEYYAGKIDPESVMDRADIEEMLRRTNAAAGGETFFYLDNETPKQHFGHLWYVGFDYQVPAWHDYDQDRFVSYSDLDPIRDPNPFDRTGAHIRRTYMEVVARQRKAGAIAVWAHPTSWWTCGDAFVTNIAADMLPQLFADGFLDGMTVQGYDAYHRDYEGLWFDLLDRGWRVPGFAEMDLCPACNIVPGALLNYIDGVAGVPTMKQMLETFRAARHSMSSGARLTMTVDGEPTGGVIKSGAGVTHRVAVSSAPAEGQKVSGLVQLLGRGGEVLAEAKNVEAGTLTFDVEGDANGGWLVARSFGENDADYRDKPQQKVAHCALTNFVRLDAPHAPHPGPVATELTLRGGASAGAPMRIVSAAGDVLLRGNVPDAKATYTVPASARLEIERKDGSARVLPLSMVNPAVRGLMEYLSTGKFRDDFAGCVPGVVPVAAFRHDEMHAALRTLDLEV